MYIVDAAGHTNRINACVNGILKSFLDSRHSFRNLETPQACLDLFLLWHNTRIIQRGKGQGKRLFHIAGIRSDSDDRLTLLGFQQQQQIQATSYLAFAPLRHCSE